jgi:hypothetical protein
MRWATPRGEVSSDPECQLADLIAELKKGRFPQLRPRSTKPWRGWLSSPLILSYRTHLRAAYSVIVSVFVRTTLAQLLCAVNARQLTFADLTLYDKNLYLCTERYAFMNLYYILCFSFVNTIYLFSSRLPLCQNLPQ